jgi:hypothetical protein
MWCHCSHLAPRCFAQLQANRKTKDKPQLIVAQRLLSSLTKPGFSFVVRKQIIACNTCKVCEPGTYLWRKNSLRATRAKTYHLSRHVANGGQHCMPSTDSDLEAFSRNPTDGSFATIAFQVTAFTKCLNEVFLSY